MEPPGRLRHLAFVLAALAGCGGDGPTSPRGTVRPVDLALPWRTADAADLGFDAPALEAAVASAEALGYVRSLVVARHGRLAREAYFGGATADTAFDVRSVTKTVTALTVGLAVADGVLAVDDPVSRWLPPDALTPAHEPIRVRHLLTMTSGIQWSDQADYGPWLFSGRPVEYVLELPVVAPPGERFIYNTGGSHLLMVIVGNALEGTALPLAEERLFVPLGMEDWRWPPVAGHPQGGAGLSLRARDLAKLGQLVLQRGRSGDAAILPEAWMEEAFREHVRLGRVNDGVLEEGGYGYQVWTESSAPPAFVMWGYGAQFVWVVPELDLVVVATSGWRGIGYERSREQYAGVSALIRDVVASAR